MSQESGTIKNAEVYRQIDKKTEDDPVMRGFLKKAVEMGNLYSYKKRYDEAINEALKDKEYMR